MDLRDPTLYAPSGAGDGAVLLALRDPATGTLAFPRTPHGIGGSGTPAEMAEPVELSGRGEVIICVTIHQPLSPGMKVPLLVARLRLEEGVVLDGVLEGTEEPAPGTRVQAVLVPEEREGGPVLACRFRVAS
ncbi:Zn-ribbon domain-containing OB-fold protein [Pseudoroseomonas ludipueritiae]|uniref:OB-fold domain-containing protein n=1 Tax=Pseudoroseomonas ludipueritiae TaxID=198093 RepID=A0ABR7R5E7_9PROT|nr:OB-fold domain-containing protein [Pseudoroseomonas ludipueritiae]MBC9176994.1 OB-fold domain-containing protein [Pseudoroseomonas ludipueritiae]